MGELLGGLLAGLLSLAILIVGAWAWLTHVYRCFTEEQWVFLITGAIFFPVAVVHGIGIWLGAW